MATKEKEIINKIREKIKDLQELDTQLDRIIMNLK